VWDSSRTQQDGLMVPKVILVDGAKVNLDETEVNRHLLDIRKNLVDGNILFDSTSTFGAVPDDPTLLAEARAYQANLLREGRFRLSPNKREVYYAIPMMDGSEQVLLKNPQEILFFPLNPCAFAGASFKP
jgi:hypothetical protein